MSGNVDDSITAEDLIYVLDVDAVDRDMPMALRMDNGPVSMRPCSSRKSFARLLGRWTSYLSRRDFSAKRVPLILQR